MTEQTASYLAEPGDVRGAIEFDNSMPSADGRYLAKGGKDRDKACLVDECKTLLRARGVAFGDQLPAGKPQAFDAAFARVAAYDCEALTTPEQLGLLERYERLRRRIPAAEHPVINSLAHQATPEELGGKLSHAVAEWALISRGEASDGWPNGVAPSKS